MKPSRPVVIAALLTAVLLLVAAILVSEFVHTAWLRGHHRPAGSTDQVADDPTAADKADEEAALKAAEPIDPASIGYHEAGTFPVAFRQPRALAADADARIYVGGDRAVQRYLGDGKKLNEIALQGEPVCLAVGGLDHVSPGQLYVGMHDHVEVYDPQGTRVEVWPSRGPQAIFTSITTTDHEVWVADAGNRLVWRFEATGRLLGPVGQPDPSQNRPGFLITDPNHFFDLAAGIDDLVYVVNPRLLHVEGYTHDGDHETTWGKGSPAVADFFGCCNPAQLAVLPDGRFVTAEKGIPRVKIYSRSGRFQTVVAGPPQLTDTPADLAADWHGRVLVLDGRAAKVRVFEKNLSKRAEKK